MIDNVGRVFGGNLGELALVEGISNFRLISFQCVNNVFCLFDQIAVLKSPPLFDLNLNLPEFALKSRCMFFGLF